MGFLGLQNTPSVLLYHKLTHWKPNNEEWVAFEAFSYLPQEELGNGGEERETILNLELEVRKMMESPCFDGGEMNGNDLELKELMKVVGFEWKPVPNVAALFSSFPLRD